MFKYLDSATNMFETHYTFCSVDDKETVLMAIDQSIRQHIQATANTPIVYEDAVINGRRIKSIDVDTVHRFVYWTDTVLQKLYR